MRKPERVLRPVDVSELEKYPISAHDRLDSHYFLQWNLKRWRASEFRRKAEPEVGWYGFQLFCIAQDETPIGTLPHDDQQLAFDLHLPLETWLKLKERDVSPLHGWRLMLCDNGQTRWAHPVVTEVALEALGSKRRNAEAAAQRKLNKRLSDLRIMVERIGATQLLSRPGFLEQFNDWLEERHGTAQRREVMVRVALDEFTVQTGM